MSLGRIIRRLHERRCARRFLKEHDRSLASWLASPKRAQILACEHTDREPNGSTPTGWPAEVCIDCGIGIVTMPPRRTA